MLNIQAVHRDPRFYNDQRLLTQIDGEREPQSVLGAFMPFGDGPRYQISYLIVKET